MNTHSTGSGEPKTSRGSHIRNNRSHFVWNDDRSFGDRPSETLIDAITRLAAEKRDEIFLDFEGDLLTFGSLDEQSGRIAAALRTGGVQRGDTVAILMDNSIAAVVSPCAVARLGAIWVPINTAYRGEFLRHQLVDCEAKTVLCDDAHLEAILAIADELGSLQMIYVRGSTRPQKEHEHIAIRPYADLLQAEKASNDERVVPSDIACLIYTSGTTGPSKGCMISHSYLCSIGRRRHRSVEPIAGDITWTCLPLFHIAALGAVLVASLLAGQRVALASRFSVSKFWDDIERSGATSAVMLASMLPLVANAPATEAAQRCYGQLRVVTGVPMSAADRNRFMERFGVGYVNSFAYGQTEANLVSLLPWGAPLPPLDSMGPPSEDFDAMVVGEDERPTAIGEPGELLVRPRQVGVMFSGYWRQPEATLNAMNGLWWHTGDIVKMDECGNLYFVDRKKDYLRSRGENISSFEVESAFLRHDAVLEVAFHAVSPESGDEEIKAVVVLENGASTTEKELFDWALANLPYFAVPRYIELRSQLPKTPTGRVQKQELRREGLNAQTWDCVAAGLVIRKSRAR